MPIQELFVILSPGVLVVIREQLEQRQSESQDAPEKARITATLATLAEVFRDKTEG